MLNCRLNIPYPEIHLTTPCERTARILYPLYAGPYGELSGVSTYLYQSIITQRNDKYMSEILECLALIEMKHFRILGRIIELCGADPMLIYTNNKGQITYWQGKFTSCEKDPDIFLRKNIEEKKYVISAYKKAYESINDKGIQDMLGRIIKDEEHHIHIFEKLLK